jgi:2-polyprenyl-3-methyl-5-hydroxy-6-metoxy-1,4-benzoquinol methylase
VKLPLRLGLFITGVSVVGLGMARFTPLPTSYIQSIHQNEEKIVKLPFSLGLFITGVGVVGLGVVGFTQLPTSHTQQIDRVNPNRVIAQTTPTDGSATPQTQPVQKDVPYVPTPTPVVNEMLRLANVKKNDVLYDLGSGDGRIVITAAQKFGTRGVGIDIDPQRIQEANQNAQKAGVTDRVQFRQQDLFQTDFKNATVVTLYLLPEVNLKLRSRLLSQLKPGTRIVSHAFDMGDWKPQKVVNVAGQTIYYWTVPQTGNNS